VLEEFLTETDAGLIEVAAALASLAQGEGSLFLDARKEPPPAAEHAPRGTSDYAPRGRDRDAFAARETYRVEVGHAHRVKPGNIVGAIANEAGIAGSHIGRVEIREDYSLVDLPAGMPKHIFKKLQRVRIGGRELRISSSNQEEDIMSKGMERKKEQKKKPAKTLEEKRALKREKRANRG
jgi:ATP-dependent RNA helicase DeaD